MGRQEAICFLRSICTGGLIALLLTGTASASILLKETNSFVSHTITINHQPLPIPRDHHPEWFLSILENLIPEFLDAGYRTRAWVRDFLPTYSDSLDELDRVDAIYKRALLETEGARGGALFACIFATFEHRTIPFKAGFELPLTLEGQEAFRQRVAKLPRFLFADAPEQDDKDKLQHFFASAWLAWAFDRETADLAGLVIEVGEELLIRGGANDPRDVRANRLGQAFAERLKKYPETLPGDLFREWNRRFRKSQGIQ